MRGSVCMVYSAWLLDNEVFAPEKRGETPHALSTTQHACLSKSYKEPDRFRAGRLGLFALSANACTARNTFFSRYRSR